MIGTRKAKKVSRRTDSGSGSREVIVASDLHIDIGVDVSEMSDEELQERFQRLKQADDLITQRKSVLPDDISLSLLALYWGALLLSFHHSGMSTLLAALFGVASVLTVPIIWLHYKGLYYTQLLDILYRETFVACQELARREEQENVDDEGDGDE